MNTIDKNSISSNISRFRVFLAPAEFDLVGFLYNEDYEIKIDFEGIRDFLYSLDGFFDEFNFPQSTHKLRNFADDKVKKGSIIKMKKEKIEIDKNDATFTIHVQFRQNASWQGSINWIEGNKTQRFRSELEMIKLMIDAMNNGKEDAGLANWND